MMLWALPVLPLVSGGLLWIARIRSRALLGGMASVALLASLTLALWAASAAPASTWPWGAGLELSLRIEAPVGVVAVWVPVIAWPVVVWAAAHEPQAGLARLVGLLVAFVGAMELLVLADDLLTLAFGWELVGGISWTLIGHHHWRTPAAAAASYAFNATRAGGLGLWVAAGASLAVTGGLAFDTLPEVAASPWGDALVAGIFVAAAAKSAQGPFAPWLFAAMEGPTAVSALLHSSTMVAAGAWIMIRLHEPLAMVPWLGPASIALGLTTALAGGVVASAQPHAKRLLAASTSAQYGLMLVAVGAGSASAALLHLVAHAAFKALLFLAAGVAIGMAGSEQLRDMRLGRRAPLVAAGSFVGALALAAVPPLGAAWTKEKVVAAAGESAAWLAVLTMLAGALSAWYAMRFQLLVFGKNGSSGGRGAGMAERLAVWMLAAISLALGVLWLPAGMRAVQAVLPGTIPAGKSWELAASVASVLASSAAAWLVYRRRSLRPPGAVAGVPATVAGWLGLPALLRWTVAAPASALARGCARFDAHVVDVGVRRAVVAPASSLAWICARFDTHVVDAGVWGAAAIGRVFSRLAAVTLDERGVDGIVRGMAARVGAVASKSRGIQTGAVPTYYSLLASGLLVLLLVLVFWR